MRAEIRISHGSEQFCAEVTVSSAPFPRKGILVNRIFDHTDRDIVAATWGTPESLAIRKKLEQAAQSLAGRYFPGIVEELLVMSREVPAPKLRALAAATAGILVRGRLSRKQAEMFFLVRREDTEEHEASVSIYEQGPPRRRTFATIALSHVELIATSAVLELWQDLEGHASATCYLAPDGWLSPKEIAERNALSAWVSTREGWAEDSLGVSRRPTPASRRGEH